MITVPDSIKELLHRDSCKKNIRIHFPNGERSDICNDLIVKDSVSFTESLCSQDTLKFGLCEAPVFECETVGVGNIKGATIEVACEIYCDSETEDAEWKMDLQAWVYALPYGKFLVAEAKRQADMIHRKITAYGAQYYIKNTNEMMEAKNRYPLASNTAYTFDILASNMMLSHFSGRIGGATYTETSGGMEPTGYIPLLYSDKVAIPPSLTRYRYGVNYICKIRNGDYGDNLYYVEMPEPSKTIDEIIHEYVGDHPVSDMRYQAGLFRTWAKANRWDKIGCGITLEKIQDRMVLYDGIYNEYADALTGFSDTNYAYLYLNTSQEESWNKPLYLAVPYAVIFTRVDNDNNLTYSDPIYFRDPDEIKIYAVTNFPKQMASFPRISKKYTSYWGITATRYYIDKENINYIDLLNDTLEMRGLFGYANHNDGFDLVNVKQKFGLLPSSTLYPNTNLYPEGVTGGKLLPEDYQSCWYDDQYTEPFGMIEVTYTNTSNETVLYNYYLTGYSPDTQKSTFQVYDLTENEIIKNNKYTEAQIEALCQNLAEAIEGVTYMPVEFVGRGLPYVEAGDTFEILTKSNDSITTIVLNRTINGEITLKDSYKSV